MQHLLKCPPSSKHTHTQKQRHTAGGGSVPRHRPLAGIFSPLPSWESPNDQNPARGPRVKSRQKGYWMLSTSDPLPVNSITWQPPRLPSLLVACKETWQYFRMNRCPAVPRSPPQQKMDDWLHHEIKQVFSVFAVKFTHFLWKNKALATHLFWNEWCCCAKFNFKTEPPLRWSLLEFSLSSIRAE